MATKLSEGLGEQVTCPICLEHYSDPRLLPCLHTYCRKCLQDLLAKGESKVSVVCPECREDVQIKSGDVTKLKVNFWINNLLSLLAIHSTEEKDGGKTELTCENCDMKETATRRCANCCMFLCDFCSTAHQRSVATKGHQLMTLDQIKSTGIPVMEKQMFCGKHKGEVKKLFCNTCQELICRDCTIIDHRDHQFSFVEDVVDRHKQLFNTEVERASNTKNKIEVVLKSVQKMKENVEKTSKATEKDVDDFIDQQIKVLERKRIVLKQETHEIAATKMKGLAAQEDGLAMHLTGLKSAIEFTEKVLTNGGNSDVLSISKQLTSRLSQLCERQFNERPLQQDAMGLQSNRKIFREWIEQEVSVVDASFPDPKQCLVTQSINGRSVQNQGAITATPGQVLNFVICVNNVFGDKLRFMEDRIEVRVCGTPLNYDTGQSIYSISAECRQSGMRVRGRRGDENIEEQLVRSVNLDSMFGSGVHTGGMFGAQPAQGGLFGHPTGGIFSAQPTQGGFAFGGTSLAQPKSNNVTTQIRDIQCHEDNTYSFDFCFDHGLSQAEINVTVDGIQIQGCPFPITRCTGIGTSFVGFAQESNFGF